MTSSNFHSLPVPSNYEIVGNLGKVILSVSVCMFACTFSSFRPIENGTNLAALLLREQYYNIMPAN